MPKSVLTDVKVSLHSPNADKQGDFIIYNSRFAHKVLGPIPGADKLRLLICGAGPSLETYAEEVFSSGAFGAVWGCNRAVNWLWEKGYPVTHGFAIDPGNGLMRPEEWGYAPLPPVEFLLASSVTPELVQHIRQQGRPITFFHNWVGVTKEGWKPPKGIRPNCTYEEWLYGTYYPQPCFMSGMGINVVNRAVGMGFAAGYKEIVILGADCAFKQDPETPDMPPMTEGREKFVAWLEKLRMYPDADFQPYTDPWNATDRSPSTSAIQVDVGGRRWHTTIDMMFSAQELAKIAKEHKHVKLVGDTLPAWLMRMPEEVFDQLLKLDENGVMTNMKTYAAVAEEPAEAVAT